MLLNNGSRYQTLLIMKPHRGTLVLVLGILGLVVCAPLAIAAWVMGSGDLKQMDAGTMDPAGRGTTNAGKICGIVGTILLILGIVIFGILFAFGLAAGLAQHH
jgi:hypothetical protein